MSALGDTVALVGVGGPDSVAGYALTTAYQRWLTTAPQGGLVSVFERNAIVAQLAWSQSMLARPPASVPRLANGLPFPFGVSRERELVLGAAQGDYQHGDVVLPQARPGGALAVAPGAAATTTVTDAQRRAAFDACGGALAYLRLQPGQLVLVPENNPGGLAYLVAGVVVAVAAVAAVAAYNTVVQARVVEAGAATQQVRIREDARVAQVVAQTNARTNALAQRLAFAQQTGTLPPPSPIETDPVQLPRVEGRAPPSTFDASVLLLPAAYAGAAAFVLGWVKWREYQTRRAVRTLGYGR